MTLKKSILLFLTLSLAKTVITQEILDISDDLTDFDYSIYDETPEPPTNSFDLHNVNTTEMLVDDQMFTEHQYQCMFNKTANDQNENSSFDCNVAGSRGFDKTVLPWYTYFMDEKKTYLLPVFVDIATYPVKMRKSLWESLKWAKNHYAKHTRIEVVFVDNYEKRFWSKGLINMINSNQGCGCCSKVGLNKKDWISKNGKGQNMHVNWCYNMAGKIVHEMMHALGWVHEHQRDDRDDFLVVGNTKSTFNCGIIPHLEKSGTPYDLGSIMHYGNGGSCKISLKPEFRGVRIGQRNGFSEMDIEEINAIYPPTGPEFAITD